MELESTSQDEPIHNQAIQPSQPRPSERGRSGRGRMDRVSERLNEAQSFIETTPPAQSGGVVRFRTPSSESVGDQTFKSTESENELHRRRNPHQIARTTGH